MTFEKVDYYLAKLIKCDYFSILCLKNQSQKKTSTFVKFGDGPESWHFWKNSAGLLFFEKI